MDNMIYFKMYSMTFPQCIFIPITCLLCSNIGILYATQISEYLGEIFDHFDISYWSITVFSSIPLQLSQTWTSFFKPYPLSPLSRIGLRKLQLWCSGPGHVIIEIWNKMTRFFVIIQLHSPNTTHPQLFKAHLCWYLQCHMSY